MTYLHRLYYALLKRHIHARPHPTDWLGDTLLTVEQNALEAFVVDWRQYGVGVALYNFPVLVRELYVSAVRKGI
ncbi:hypothetical protein KDA23_03170 [Candidatus Saccharibacteria bacterium]|nr:hypothetical protein [Candidatus Saccharibacteria bacterium]